MSFLCAARFVQGREQSVTTSEWSITRGVALMDVVAKMPVGHKPSEHNLTAALDLLDQLEREPMSPGDPQRRQGHAYLDCESAGLHVIQIGWVNYAIRGLPDAWAIGAHVTTVIDGFTSTRQIPTFYLDPRVQGCLTPEGARRAAVDIIRPYPDHHQYEVHVAVEPIWH